MHHRHCWARHCWARRAPRYIVFGMRAVAGSGDLYPANPAFGRHLGYNTDVVLDRAGAVVGHYRKSWPCCPPPAGAGVSMDDGYPSREMAKVFDLDFGRVGLQTCFDMNFDDTWYTAAAAISIWTASLHLPAPLCPPPPRCCGRVPMQCLGLRSKTRLKLFKTASSLPASQERPVRCDRNRAVHVIPVLAFHRQASALRNEGRSRVLAVGVRQLRHHFRPFTTQF